jgi:hypothetical protein
MKKRKVKKEFGSESGNGKGKREHMPALNA